MNGDISLEESKSSSNMLPWQSGPNSVWWDARAASRISLELAERSKLARLLWRHKKADEGLERNWRRTAVNRLIACSHSDLRAQPWLAGQAGAEGVQLLNWRSWKSCSETCSESCESVAWGCPGPFPLVQSRRILIDWRALQLEELRGSSLFFYEADERFLLH